MKQLNKRLLSWASILEDKTRAQAEQTSTLPFIFPHMALMPDAHLGKGSTVGSVIPTVGAIIPAAVGVDLGCGMAAVRTQWTRPELMDALGGDLSTLRRSIEAQVPLSAGKYNQTITNAATRRVSELEHLAGIEMAEQVAPNWYMQLGSLGSGNHFIEVSVDELDRVWLFLHSGSRGVGNKIAQYHIKVARALAERYFIPLPDPDLAYLAEDTPEFDAYIQDLRWAQHFALLNRNEMMDRVADQLALLTGVDTERQQEINCHHNYTARERHFGRDVWLSRKGAIDAHGGVWGLIPGSMGDASYVVQGKGNLAALCSAPHGAGRAHSRSAAKRLFTHEQLVKAMDGIEWSGSKEFLDEIPGAYKPIDVVMRDAAHLVTVQHVLRQLLNVKGD